MLTIPQIKAVKAEVARMFAEGELLKIEDPPPACEFCEGEPAEMVWNKGGGRSVLFCLKCFETEGVT